MRASLLPPLTLALVAWVSGCSLNSGALLGDACYEPDMAAACDLSGFELLSCTAGVPSSEETCVLGCTPRAESCWICTPYESRCDGDGIVRCNGSGSVEEPNARCAPGSCNDDGMGSAMCGACLPDTSRCNATADATIACGSGGLEAPPVSCAAGEHCEARDGGTTASCVGDCVAGCVGDELVTCAGGEVRQPCPLGCDMATSECHALVPSNVGDRVASDLGTSGLSVGVASPEVLIFDTDDDGRIDRYDPATGARTVVRMAVSDAVDAGIYHERLDAVGSETPSGAPMPNLAIWVMDSLNVGAMGTIHFVGSRAAVLLVEGDVLVDGRINARAEWLLDTDGLLEVVRAPAGAHGERRRDGRGYGGGDEGDNDSSRHAGGGGGSFGSSGGRGGDAGGSTAWSEAGRVYGSEELVPLYGGSAGGAGSDEVAAGGDGGGALQISAGGTLTVSAGAIIDASGQGGYGASADRGGGGGGGSGGGLLLEAAAISIAGIIGVPGGGGAGGSRNPADGFRGTRWDPPGELRGRGGEGTGMYGGRGGHGSDDTGSNGSDGQRIEDPNGGAGGGGGGAGRVRLNTRPGTTPTMDGRVVPSGALSTVGEVGVL